MTEPHWMTCVACGELATLWDSRAVVCFDTGLTIHGCCLYRAVARAAPAYLSEDGAREAERCRCSWYGPDRPLRRVEDGGWVKTMLACEIRKPDAPRS